jgi:hypothetical protein
LIANANGYSIPNNKKLGTNKEITAAGKISLKLSIRKVGSCSPRKFGKRCDKVISSYYYPSDISPFVRSVAFFFNKRGNSPRVILIYALRAEEILSRDCV